MRFLISLLALAACDFVTAVEPIHVLVWDERQPRQSEAYENFLGNEIVAQLSKTTDDIEFRSVCLDDPQQGLSVENVNWSDVIIWWGHVRQKEVTEDNINRVVDHILSGDGDLIALHSAHWSSPLLPR